MASSDSLLNGRVGAFAVALGIGVAVLTAPGVVIAEPDTATESTSDTESTGAQQDSAPSVEQEQAVEQVEASADSASQPAESGLTEAISDPRDGIVQASGGANTMVSAADVGEAVENTTPAKVAATPKESNTTAAADSVTTEPTSTLSATTIRSAAADTALPSVGHDWTQPEPEQAPQVIASVALISPASTPATLEARQVDPVTTVVTRVVDFAVGLLSIGQSPAAPAPVAPPAPWVLLAWVRRQFETLFDESPRVNFGAITTSQSEAGIVSGTISSVDRDAVATRVVTGPANGTVSVNATTGEFTYTPHAALARSGGIDTFTVAVDDVDAPRYGLVGVIAALAGDRDGAAVATVTVAVLPAGGADPDTLDAAELVGLAADGKVRIDANDNGTVRIIDGTFTDAVVRTGADAASAMNGVAGLLGATAGFADESDITVQSLALLGDDAPSEVIYRLQPTVDGIPTMSSQVVLVTDGDGTVTGVFSSYDNRINDVDTVSRADLDEETVAMAAARAALISSLADHPDPDAILAVVAMHSDLVIYDVDPDVAPSLARRVTVYTTEIDADTPAISRTYYLYANGADAGEVFAEITNLNDATTAWVTTTKTATDLKGKSRTITVEYQASSNSYRFNDVTRLVGTYSASSTSTAPGTLVTKSRWASWNKSAVSAHANTAVTYDYYLNTLVRRSFDGAGAALRVSVLPNTYNNAYWDPNLKILVFGHDTEAALDVVGHEFTHAVVQYAVANGGGLIYKNESGALNESYADILGSLIENKTGAARWQIAEDYRCGSWSGCTIRDMSNPAKYGQPTHYANRYTGTADYGGVHTNSGIFNFAAYKMMTDTRTSTISTATWSRVFYGSMFKLSTNATFRDARAAVLSTAVSQGFTTAQQQAIIDAFNAVGITA